VRGLRDKLFLEFQDALSNTEASFQFLKIKRLGDVIVGTCFQPLVNLLLVPLLGMWLSAPGE